MDETTTHRRYLSRFLEVHFPHRENMTVERLSKLFGIWKRISMEEMSGEVCEAEIIRLVVDTFRLWFMLDMDSYGLDHLVSRVERLYHRCKHLPIYRTYILFTRCLLEIKRIVECQEVSVVHLPLDDKLVQKLARMEFLLLNYL